MESAQSNSAPEPTKPRAKAKGIERQGPLKNARHERFAQEYAKGKTAVEAHEIAGYSRNDGNCSTILNRPDVRRRVTEIQARAAERTAITLESLTGMALEDREKSIELKQMSAAGRNLGMIAQWHGFVRERVEVDHKGAVRLSADMTDLELARRIALAMASASATEVPAVIDGTNPVDMTDASNINDLQAGHANEPSGQ